MFFCCWFQGSGYIIHHLEIHSTCGDVIWWKQGSAGCVSHQPIVQAVGMGGTAGRAGYRNSPGNLHHPTVFFRISLIYIDIMPQRISTQQKLKQQQVVRLGLSISSPHWIFEKKKKDDIPTEIPVPTFGPFGLLRETYLPRSYPPLRNKG